VHNRRNILDRFAGKTFFVMALYIFWMWLPFTDCKRSDPTAGMIWLFVQQQIDALNDAKKAVKDYVDQQKEAMRAEKENIEYEDELADKLKAIAKLQSKIDALSLDDSRKAQAEKMALEEELTELQKDLADYQVDHALGVTG